MRKIAYILFIAVLAGCGKYRGCVSDADAQMSMLVSHEEIGATDKFIYDSMYTSDVIKNTCKFLAEHTHPNKEEAARLDRIASEGKFYVVSGADRELDTTVNHTRVRFVGKILDMDSLMNECKWHTEDMAKSDSVVFRRGWYITMLGDTLHVEPYDKRKGVIDDVCSMISEVRPPTKEDLWDYRERLYDGSNYALVRNADRSLDTIVNYERLIFTILP